MLTKFASSNAFLSFQSRWPLQNCKLPSLNISLLPATVDLERTPHKFQRHYSHFREENGRHSPPSPAPSYPIVEYKGIS